LGRLLIIIGDSTFIIGASLLDDTWSARYPLDRVPISCCCVDRSWVWNITAARIIIVIIIYIWFR